MKQFEDLKIPLNPLKGTSIRVNAGLTVSRTHFQNMFLLADVRKVFAKLRRINNYIPGFRQRFIGTLAHWHIGTLFHIQSQEPRTKNQDKATHLHHLITSSPYSEPRTKNQDGTLHSFIPSFLHSSIGTSSYRHIVSLTFLFLSLTPGLKAQLLTPLSNEMNRRVEYEMIQNGTPFFTVMKPYITPESPEGDYGESRDSANFAIDTSTHRHIGTLPHRHTGTSAHRSWFHRKLFHESLIQVDSGIFYLYVDPVFEFGVGRETSGRNTYINTRGLRAGGRLGKYVAFGTEFYENQGIFNSAISAQVKKTSFFPGHGIARKYDSTGYDFSFASGYLSVTLLQKLNIRLAQGRQFIGDGYRSLLLSDAAYAYPYLKFTWQSNLFLYSWDHLLLQDYGVPMATRNGPTRRKSATIHTAAINIKNKVQLSVIKMQLYNNPDSFGNYTFRFSQLNPLLIPGNSKNSHAIWGFNLKVTPLPKLSLYSQFTIDNLFSDKEKHVAVQVGGKYFINVGSHLFYVQAEYNRVPAMTYTSQYRIYSWKNLTEPLAHPYGHNFKETVFIGTWNYKHLQISTQANLAQQLETITDTKPYTQAALNYYPNSKKLYWYNAELTYYFNPKTLMNVSLGFNYRKEILSTGNNTMNYIYFSFGTRLFNKYYDF